METKKGVDSQVEIIRLVGAGKKELAFRILEQEYKDLLMIRSRTIKLSFVYNDADRLDAVLKAFEDVYNKISKGEVVSNLPYYLFAFVKNNLLNINKRWRRFYRPLEFFEPNKINVATIDQNIARYHGVGDDRMYSANKALEKLGVTCRRIIRLKKLDNRSHEEIVLLVPEVKSASNSAKRLERCMKSLKKLVAA